MMSSAIFESAFIAESALQGTPRGIVLAFHGLGTTELRREPNSDELLYGEHGAVCVFPYTGPWAWMNRQAQAMTDALVVAIRKKYKLSRQSPLIATGGSMGGMAALTYTRYSKPGVCACLTNCPVADLPFHYTERADLPRTLRCAFWDAKPSFAAALKAHSPLHQARAGKMPKVPYLVVHGGQDTAVRKDKHGDPLVAALQKTGRQVEYIEVPAMGHCGPLPHAVAARMRGFVLANLGR